MAPAAPGERRLPRSMIGGGAAPARFAVNRWTTADPGGRIPRVSFMRMHTEQVDSDAALVRRLLEGQYPQWADLAIERVVSSGTDNAIYRLGTEMVVRLPLIHWAVGQVEKEHTWLPQLAPLLPLAVPEPLAMGEPAEGYPWHWSVYRWIDGENAYPDRVGDLRETANELAAFVNVTARDRPSGCAAIAARRAVGDEGRGDPRRDQSDAPRVRRRRAHRGVGRGDHASAVGRSARVGARRPFRRQPPPARRPTPRRDRLQLLRLRRAGQRPRRRVGPLLGREPRRVPPRRSAPTTRVGARSGLGDHRGVRHPLLRAHQSGHRHPAGAASLRSSPTPRETGGEGVEGCRSRCCRR